MDEAPTLTKRRVFGRFANALAGKRPADRIGVSTRELMLVWPDYTLHKAAERLLREPGLGDFEIGEISASAVFFRRKSAEPQTLIRQGVERRDEAAE